MKRRLLSETVDNLDIARIFKRIETVKMGVLGDLCLDVYWDADMCQSELSRETPRYPLPVVNERFSLGGAANVCANAADLGATVTALGVVGNDWRGTILTQCCKERGIIMDYLVCDPERFTNAYCKSMCHGISEVIYEDPRLDFCTLQPISMASEEELLAGLEQLDADVLCVSDQLKYGCVTHRIREQIIRMGMEGMRIIVDSRDRIGLYTNVCLKPNEIEGYRAVHGKMPKVSMALEDYAYCAEKLSEQTNTTVFMTLGAQGCIGVMKGETCQVTAAAVSGQVDFVGAGDTMLASLGAALAVGAEVDEAMAFANLCASVTITKIGVTGTPSQSEVLAAAEQIKSAGKIS